MKNVQESADLIQMQIKEAELADDVALLAKARLMHSMVQARIDHALHPMQGHAELVRLNNASKLQLDARSNLGRVHSGLTDIADSVKAEVDHKDYPPAQAMVEQPTTV